jgi:hypothetical protein
MLRAVAHGTIFRLHYSKARHPRLYRILYRQLCGLIYFHALLMNNIPGSRL